MKKTVFAGNQQNQEASATHGGASATPSRTLRRQKMFVDSGLARPTNVEYPGAVGDALNGIGDAL
ncbi:hypothetical protein HanHA300_Chr02g0050961 [Helianthus annuus]|nr:hypothetical protein HanHA300_Chr02g0050961 [Helianthus annuus]